MCLLLQAPDPEAVGEVEEGLLGEGDGGGEPGAVAVAAPRWVEQAGRAGRGAGSEDSEGSALGL